MSGQGHKLKQSGQTGHPTHQSKAEIELDNSEVSFRLVILQFKTTGTNAKYVFIPNEYRTEGFGITYIQGS